MTKKTIYCPLCNAKKVHGLGLVIYESSALVEYRCRVCGELFFMPDQRERETVQTAADDSASLKIN